MTSPLYLTLDDRLSTPHLFAVDTETTLFRPREPGYNDKTCIRPFGYPDLILGSVAGENHLRVEHRQHLLATVRALLEDKTAHLVFHNAAFDIPVLIKADFLLEPLFRDAVDEGRIHDTKILEVLLQIAVSSAAVSSKLLVQSPSLKKIAKERAGMDLEKSDIRVTFGQFADPTIPIPMPYLEYAAQDALATYLCYRSQVAEARVILANTKSRFPVFPDAEQKFGLLSERIQIQGSLAFAWLEQFPLRVDVPLAAKLLEDTYNETLRYEDVLISFGFAKKTPKKKTFHLLHKHLRDVLKRYADENAIVPEWSDTGLLSLRADFWDGELPQIPPGLYADPASARTDAEKLQVWLRYSRARKLLMTYLYVYSSSEVHYPKYENIGARTARTSSSRPNVQNIPKNNDGIRGIFLATPGYVLIEGDYVGAELIALAEIYHHMFGGSVLETELNAGHDVHKATARRLIPDFDQLPEPQQKFHRQNAKAVNFGLPGGLGAATLQKYAKTRYQSNLTLDEAKLLRSRALAADPQLSAYLSEELSFLGRLEVAAENLGLSLAQMARALDAVDQETGDVSKFLLSRNFRRWYNSPSRYPQLQIPAGIDLRFDLGRQTTRTLTGRVRGRAIFTEAHNTPFQGLIADAGKIALWKLAAGWSWERSPWRPVAFVHDSILIEAIDSPEMIEFSQKLLVAEMETAIQEVCPHVLGRVEVKVCGPRWGRNTDAFGSPQTPSELPERAPLPAPA